MAPYRLAVLVKGIQTQSPDDAIAVGQRIERDAIPACASPMRPQHNPARLLGSVVIRNFGSKAVNPSQSDRQLVFVDLGVRLSGDRQRRLKYCTGFQHQGLGLVRECAAGFGSAQFADCADVARHHRGCGMLLLTK